MTNKEVAVAVRNIHKEFVLPQNKNTTFKQTVVNIVKKNNKVTQKTLDGVSFDVNKGDFFGIVGRNGSGKSTLLKLIAGVYTPTAGSITVNGGLTPFIELGVGFNPELSGRDNVYLNGALLGFTRKQMAAMYDEIVSFAELGPFMDQKLKNYSSGMQVRLAFSIAIRAKADVLILDEVLAVGDEAFQRKCNDYFSKIHDDKDQTVILVTHSMEAVKQYCNKAIMLKDGKIIAHGDPMDVANEYTLSNFDVVSTDDADDNSDKVNNYTLSVKPVSSQVLKSGDDITVEIQYELDKEAGAEDVFSSVALYINNAPIVFDTTRDKNMVSKIGINKIRYSYPTGDISEGAEVRVVAELWRKSRQRHNDTELAFIDMKNAATFKIISPKRPNGDVLRKRGAWTYGD